VDYASAVSSAFGMTVCSGSAGIISLED
jgi:hypothetical protein